MPGISDPHAHPSESDDDLAFGHVVDHLNRLGQRHLPEAGQVVGSQLEVDGSAAGVGLQSLRHAEACA